MLIVEVIDTYTYYFSDLGWSSDDPSDNRLHVILCNSPRYWDCQNQLYNKCKETLLLHSAVQVNKFMLTVCWAENRESMHYYCDLGYHPDEDSNFYHIVLNHKPIQWGYYSTGRRENLETLLLHSAVQVSKTIW